MSFHLKNVGSTYKKMMNKIFDQEIGVMLEVYMDYMIGDYIHEKLRDAHLIVVFKHVHHVNMRLNPYKCTFKVNADKFLWFHLKEKEIEDNTDKCDTTIKMKTSSMKERIINLNGIAHRS